MLACLSGLVENDNNLWGILWSLRRTEEFWQESCLVELK
jgi:hypothetical protein